MLIWDSGIDLQILDDDALVQVSGSPPCNVTPLWAFGTRLLAALGVPVSPGPLLQTVGFGRPSRRRLVLTCITRNVVRRDNVWRRKQVLISDAAAKVPPLALDVRWQVLNLLKRLVERVAVLKCHVKASVGPGARRCLKARSVRRGVQPDRLLELPLPPEQDAPSSSPSKAVPLASG